MSDERIITLDKMPGWDNYGEAASATNVCPTSTESTKFGADTAWLDLTTLLTLEYIRWNLRNTFQTKYPRHKLADDDARFGAGQAVITPKIAKAECVALFGTWEEKGLVEGIDRFKADLVVERNASDPNRLDFLLTPDLINQFIVGAAKIAFVL